MTLIITFAILTLLGIPFIVWDSYVDEWSVWRAVTGWLLIIVFGFSLVIAILVYVPSKKNSEIEYMQLVQEKASIEQMISSGENVDKLMLNQRVIDYNNKIIEIKENSKRFVLSDYYSKDVNWDDLELIEWR